MSQTPDTVVHLLRHGEVHNPEGVLYGRRDGFHLSDLGREMAEKTAASLAARDVTTGKGRERLKAGKLSKKGVLPLAAHSLFGMATAEAFEILRRR